jgi:hypothetical protein
MKMGLEDVQCYAEKYLEVVWGFITALLTITYRINVVYMFFVVRPTDGALLHFKFRET